MTEQTEERFRIRHHGTVLVVDTRMHLAIDGILAAALELPRALLYAPPEQWSYEIKQTISTGGRLPAWR